MQNKEDKNLITEEPVVSSWFNDVVDCLCRWGAYIKESFEQSDREKRQVLHGPGFPG